MAQELMINLLRIFSWAHNSALAQTNVITWALGTVAGLSLAVVVGTRFRVKSERGNCWWHQ